MADMVKTELSEYELLLLSNYEYFKCSTEAGTIKENIDRLRNEDGSFDMEKVISQGATGDIISEDDAVDILNRLYENERLSNMHNARCIDRGGIRATLYTDVNDSNPALVFRGTGGTYKAWEDNVLGEYKADTRLQRLASDFVRYECSAYKDITTTGHSKGSNLAQYVTVVCASQVDRCVGYDGQGFSKKFLKEYKEEIKTAKEKITAISGYNDFVNILLTPIAGKILYVKNQEGLGVDMHSCYTMLSNGSFDANGDFKRDFGVIPQLPAMTMAKWASDGIVYFLDSLPEDGNEKASKILAAWTASMLSADQSVEYERMKEELAISDFKQYTKQLLSLSKTEEKAVDFRCEYLNIYIDRVKNICVELDNIEDQLRVYPEMVEDLLVRLDYSILCRSLTENALKKIITKLDRNIMMLDKFRVILTDIVKRYESADM